MIAHLTDTEPYELIIQLGDAHVYRDHVNALKAQLKGEFPEFPELKWKRGRRERSEDFEMEDFEVVGYESWPSIPMKMSV